MGNLQANELRIGNWYLSFGVDLKQVESITKDKILIDFHPIPLTEEWLLKFGFEYHHKIISRRFYNIGNLFAEVGGDGRTAIYGTLAGELMCFVNYVHQLQNLYFALTGEELILKD